MKVIIAGGRDFNDYERVEFYCDLYLKDFADEDIEIVSGGAKGADALGERYATQNHLKLTRFPANWTKYGRSAGPKRNAEMAAYADMLIVFWDGSSRGTKNMIETAGYFKLKVHIVEY